mmetsp:Transcript_23877/g.44318  ORF Transcript_23877/g.44318 Transcript_23877/m.44318 type:complete len:393 (-) Transcript_23877:49-1227(-)
MTEYIPQSGLDALRQYKYQGGEYSWLDLKLNGFWFWCAERLPLWVAPNLVTLVGTFHLLAIVILALVFDPELSGQSPSWVYFANAWCLFVYQTMDAVDGKQARRTGSSSPLGQLFDHGCDALGSTFIAIGLNSIMGFGGSLTGVAVLSTVQIPFYLCQWEENHVHKLRAQVGNFGVTEGQYLSMALNLVTGAAGTWIWKLTFTEIATYVPGLDVVLPYLGDTTTGTMAIVLGAFFPGVLALSTVVSVAKEAPNFLWALILTMPLVLQQALMVVICQTVPAMELFRQYPIFFMVCFGVLHAHLSNRIIVASVCKLQFPLVHRILYPVPLIIGTMYWMDARQSKDGDLLATAFALYGIAVVLQFAHFVYNVTIALTTLLGIKCFTLQKKKANKD